MKIGIITFWDTKDNYGQLLQCYALQTFLRKMGHEAFLIRYKSKPVTKPQFQWRKILNYIIKFPTYISLFFDITNRSIKIKKYGRYVNENNIRNFESFRAKHIIATEKIYSEQELYNIPPKADAYICGSDQIWGGDPIYYLPFAPTSSKKIAYAPSFGGVRQMDSKYELKIKKYLSSFCFVGVREQSGVELCHQIGIEKAVKVVDPTMLLPLDDYNKIRKKASFTKPYIFLYLLGNPISYSVSLIYKFAKKHNFNVIYVASQGRLDSYKKAFPEIGEWIDYLANADFIVTNSFHCTVFSLLYGKKFATIPLTKGFKRMNVRIDDLLTESRLTSTILQHGNTLDKIYHTNFDFSHFEEYRKREIQKTYNYLYKSLVP